jgi:hypothetical protein
MDDHVSDFAVFIKEEDELPGFLFVGFAFLNKIGGVSVDKIKSVGLAECRSNVFDGHSEIFLFVHQDLVSHGSTFFRAKAVAQPRR